MSELPLQHVSENQRRQVAEAYGYTEKDWATLRRARAFALSALPDLLAALPTEYTPRVRELYQRLEASAQQGLEQPDPLHQSMVRDDLLKALDLLTEPLPR